ncbi:hypothetical protein DENSPDRAFT_853582 [Dentipellis sp. KUC8613]|nr:hypothetical protein DENSPDRAFT_853582 [Dentipellis sp. KUC8613]
MPSVSLTFRRSRTRSPITTTMGTSTGTSDDAPSPITSLLSLASATASPSSPSPPSPSTPSSATTLVHAGIPAPAAHPSWAAQPWPYIFRTGDRAWALSGNGRWRRVTVLDDGEQEEIDGRPLITYTATWTHDGLTFRGAFAPAAGTLKPDTARVRGLIEDERGGRYACDGEGVGAEGGEGKGCWGEYA